MSQLSLAFCPPAFRDPRSASVLPPFMRARRFIEHVGALSAADWEDVFLNASVNAAPRIHAAWHLGTAPLSSSEWRAQDALRRIARHAVNAARDRKAIHRDVVEHAVSLVSNAALALVLREWLPAHEFDALYRAFTLGSRASARPWTGSRSRVPRRRATSPR